MRNLPHTLEETKNHVFRAPHNIDDCHISRPSCRTCYEALLLTKVQPTAKVEAEAKGPPSTRSQGTAQPHHKTTPFITMNFKSAGPVARKTKAKVTRSSAPGPDNRADTSSTQ